MAKLRWEDRMTITSLIGKGCSNRHVARLLQVTEGSVRYHRRRMAEGIADGRAKQMPVAAGYREAIDAYLEANSETVPANIADLHAWLVAEHDYPAGLRSVQRYVRRAFPAPARRAWRRVETPPGAQGQVDWAYFPNVWIGGEQRDLLAFVLTLSYSRAWTMVWSERKHQLAWLSAHNAAFERIGGVPATIRVDNEKTAVILVILGAGAWGTVNPVYQRYAQTLRFHVDACAPRSPEAKGKVERRIRDGRLGCSPYRQHWESVAALQAATDERCALLYRKRICPATGTEFLDIEGDLLEHLGNDARRHGGGDQRAGQDTAQHIEGQRTIDAPCGLGLEMALGGAPGGQGCEVVTHYLGTEVLAGAKPRQGAGVLEVEAMFDALERLLDAPALMVELAEGLGGKALGVEQRSHHHTHLALGRNLADQAHSRRTAGAFIVGCVARGRCGQAHDRFTLAGTHEAAHHRETAAFEVTANTERDLALDQ